MLIICPSCATSYDVDLATLSPAGRQVRCSRCSTVWHAELSQADKILAAAAAIAPHAEPAVAPATAPGASADPAVPPPEAAAPEAIGEVLSVPAELAEGGGEHAGVDSPPIVPADHDAGEPLTTAEEHAASEPAEDIESFAARRYRRNAKRRAASWPLSRLQSAILALALINIVLVAWRRDVVRIMPQTASFYAMLGLPVNLRGLAFDNVATAMEQHEGVPILVVEGNVYNSARKTEDVPRLKFIVRNAARQEVYSWMLAPSRNALQPGEVESFRTRLASPPPDAHDIVLRFVNRRDILAGDR
ncbi:MAG TPA: zinc-ribbon domain-containing protein [Xanthobacteraceae bacterium]|nr:zinc-ribbon domain-containing protein [Xanthobacteraceae bacterium]